jgi:segregation and condensation protein B
MERVWMHSVGAIGKKVLAVTLSKSLRIGCLGLQAVLAASGAKNKMAFTALRGESKRSDEDETHGPSVLIITGGDGQKVHVTGHGKHGVDVKDADGNEEEFTDASEERTEDAEDIEEDVEDIEEAVEEENEDGQEEQGEDGDEQDQEDGDQEDGDQEDGDQEDGDQEDGDQEDGEVGEEGTVSTETDKGVVTGSGKDPELEEDVEEMEEVAKEKPGWFKRVWGKVKGVFQRKAEEGVESKIGSA